jgi:hypothetical protein
VSTTLDTVEDYIADVRVLLQDNIQPYRYDDPSLLAAFNSSLLEARRIRADLFVYRHNEGVPNFSTVDSEEVHIEPAFRLAFVYGTVAHALMRDQEDIEDARASSFRAAFNTMLIGTGAAAIATPPGNASVPRGTK